MNFADNLKQLRTSKKITQKELADHLNMSRSAIAGYETRQHHPDFETLEKISKFFHVSIAFLIKESESDDFSNIEISEAYNQLSSESKQDVLNYIKSLQTKEKNK